MFVKVVRLFELGYRGFDGKRAVMMELQWSTGYQGVGEKPLKLFDES